MVSLLILDNGIFKYVIQLFKKFILFCQFHKLILSSFFPENWRDKHEHRMKRQPYYGKYIILLYTPKEEKGVIALNRFLQF